MYMHMYVLYNTIMSDINLCTVLKKLETQFYNVINHCLISTCTCTVYCSYIIIYMYICSVVGTIPCMYMYITYLTSVNTILTCIY